MTRKAKSISPEKLPAPQVVPASTPRNPIAVNPLLKKSGAHADKRRRAMQTHATQELLQSKRRTLKDDADE